MREEEEDKKTHDRPILKLFTTALKLIDLTARFPKVLLLLR
jgi:hypothetical protein